MTVFQPCMPRCRHVSERVSRWIKSQVLGSAQPFKSPSRHLHLCGADSPSPLFWFPDPQNPWVIIKWCQSTPLNGWWFLTQQITGTGMLALLAISVGQSEPEMAEICYPCTVWPSNSAGNLSKGNNLKCGKWIKYYIPSAINNRKKFKTTYFSNDGDRIPW